MQMDDLQKRLAVTAAALGDDPREISRQSRRFGFAGLQFDAIAKWLDLTELSVTGRREFRHVLASADQQLAGLRVELGHRGLGPGADIDRVLSRFDQVMDAARGLGAPLVCVDLGSLPEPAPVPAQGRPAISPEQAGLILLPESAPAPPAPVASVQPDPAFIAQVDAALVELGARADRFGVMLALRSDLASFAALERALVAARCPWFGIDFDPVAVLRDPWTLDEILSRFGSLVRHVRARDAVAGADRRTRPAVVGAGATNWPALLAALDSAAYRGWLTLDPLELADRAGAAIAGLEHLKHASPS
jgi:sugar phosphate isomerase/epimerase